MGGPRLKVLTAAVDPSPHNRKGNAQVNGIGKDWQARQEIQTLLKVSDDPTQRLFNKVCDLNVVLEQIPDRLGGSCGSPWKHAEHMLGHAAGEEARQARQSVGRPTRPAPGIFSRADTMMAVMADRGHSPVASAWWQTSRRKASKSSGRRSHPGLGRKRGACRRAQLDATGRPSQVHMTWTSQGAQPGPYGGQSPLPSVSRNVAVAEPSCRPRPPEKLERDQAG